MGMRELTWKFSKTSYRPGDKGTMNFWLDNAGPTFLGVSDLGLQFEHQVPSGEWWPCLRSAQIRPGRSGFAGSIPFTLPKLVIGTQKYSVFCNVLEWNDDPQEWQDMATVNTSFEYGINVFPLPLYQAFFSRSIRREDRPSGDEIADAIQEWGFDPVTVGIEIIVDDQSRLDEVIRQEVLQSDCLIAIAIPRTLDILTRLWHTLEWLHGESGIAFGVDKPILILKENSVTLGGLPGQFREFVIDFNQFDIQDLRAKLSIVMPGFRQSIASKRNQEFIKALGKVALGGLAVVGIGSIASALSKPQEENTA